MSGLTDFGHFHAYEAYVINKVVALGKTANFLQDLVEYFTRGALGSGLNRAAEERLSIKITFGALHLVQPVGE
jgi:hypothetical protein